MCFSDEGFEATFDRYFSWNYSWDSLSAFRDSKNHIQLTLGGEEFIVRKEHFTQSGVTQILTMLRARY